MRFRKSSNFSRKRKIICILILIITFANTSLSSATEQWSGKLISETYIVKLGDTLWSISEMYINKNTYGPRDRREFYYGIIEANWDTIFNHRPVGLIIPGDKLVITYFVKE